MKYALLVLSALTAAAPAAAADVRTVKVDGRTISYVVQPRDDGSYVLASAPRETSDFRLTVKKGWVIGDFNGAAVSYPVPRPKVDRASAD